MIFLSLWQPLSHFHQSFLPWHRVRIEVLLRVDLAEELHPENGEDVDDDDEQEGEVAEGSQRRDDDAEQDLHRRPRLGQFEHAHLERQFHHKDLVDSALWSVKHDYDLLSTRPVANY